MNATDIVNVVGSIKKMADLLGVSETQIYRMTYDKNRHNGTGNKIPSKYWNIILQYSDDNNLGITKDEFWDMM